MSSIVTFIGWQDSDKAPLVSKVVKQLITMGYRVAVIKSSSEAGVVFDTPGTDTSLYREAGAESVMFVGPDQMVLQARNQDLSLRTLAHRFFSDVDIVIGEGFKTSQKIPKIEVCRNPEQMLGNEVHGVIATVSDLEEIAGEYVFRLHETTAIARFIEKRYLQGKRRTDERLSLLVNGTRVPLKGFVQNALAGTIHGFVSSLKLVDKIDEIELRIKF
ncbi:MAG: molybdopterin-guanine dinucleotide biosynthesis protein B [Desulfopila sp.]